jgi:putative Mn2+ efflux pump MntP
MTGINFLSLFFIALGDSADCFAVALSGSCAAKNLTRLQALRASASFGIFQAVMPLLGRLAGRTFVNIIGGYDHWVAFALLTAVGGRAIWESFHPEKEENKTDFTKGWILLTLSFATSIDAFAVGLSFAFLKVNIVTAGLLIGVTTFLVSILGFALGRKVGDYVGKRAELVGGLILIAIGLQILLTHLL